MQLLKNISQLVSKRELWLFLAFYLLSTLVYYTASWVSYGAFSPGHPPYFDLAEFLASGGLQFFISLLITVPIWYIIFVRLAHLPLKILLASHIFFLPLYICLSYYSLLYTKELIGWAMIWGGYATVWKLYIFLLFYLVQFGFIHAYHYFKRYKNEEKEKAVLREMALQSELVALKSQLNPHFLHNLFNSINATIPPENERTRELIVQLSDLFRYQNYASQHEYVTIQEEIDFIESYLQLMKLRLKERLNFYFAVPERLRKRQIAPMLLQPLVENAITHGISPKVGASSITVEIMEVSEGKLRYIISDTGVGIAHKEDALSRGLGLSNTQMRLNKIYHTSLIIEDNKPSGTKISFTI